MLDVFLCHSESNRPIAEQIAGRLQAGAEAKVWLEETGSLPEVWGDGMSSTAIILLLAKDSVPAQSTRATWSEVLGHGGRPPVACVRTEICAYPPLLERSNFFDWQAGPLATLRSLERWVVGMHAQQNPKPFSPSALPWFEGRQSELETLWRTLVDDGGGYLTLRAPTAAGKTALAQEFARAASEHFRETLWVCCSGRSEAAVGGDLMSQLGAKTDRDLPGLLHQHRLLVVFDDLEQDLPLAVSLESRASVLITTRQPGPGLMLAPLAPVSIALPSDAAALHLWRAMSVCQPAGFPLQLACRIAGITEEEGAWHAKALISRRLVDPLDEGRLRMSADCRNAAQRGSGLEALQRAHLDQMQPTGDLLAEIPTAIEFACRTNWKRAQQLGFTASDFLRKLDRHPEAAEILHQLLTPARLRKDDEAIGQIEWELSWIEDAGQKVRRPMQAGEQLQLGLTL